MAQPVDQSAWDRLCIGAGALECPFDPRLQRALGDAFTVATDEQRGTCRPPRQTGSFCRSTLLSLREADSAAVEIRFDDCEELGFGRDAAFFPAFALDVDNRSAVIGGADISDVGLAEFLGAQPGQQCGQYDREIPLSPVSLAVGIAVLRDGFQQRFDAGAGE